MNYVYDSLFLGRSLMFLEESPPMTKDGLKKWSKAFDEIYISLPDERLDILQLSFGLKIQTMK